MLVEVYRQSEEHFTHFRVHTTDRRLSEYNYFPNKFNCALLGKVFASRQGSISYPDSSGINAFFLNQFSVSVPLTPLSTFMGRWVFGEALCKLLPASQVTMSMAMMKLMMVVMVVVMVAVVVVVKYEIW